MKTTLLSIFSLLLMGWGSVQNDADKIVSPA